MRGAVTPAVLAADRERLLVLSASIIINNGSVYLAVGFRAELVSENCVVLNNIQQEIRFVERIYAV